MENPKAGQRENLSGTRMNYNNNEKSRGAGAHSAFLVHWPRLFHITHTPRGPQNRVWLFMAHQHMAVQGHKCESSLPANATTISTASDSFAFAPARLIIDTFN